MDQPLNVSSRMNEDDQLLDDLLQGTSRTFALAIPLLRPDRRRQIGLAYLLFRVADSIEDASETEVACKVRLLRWLKDSIQQKTSRPDSDSISPIEFEELIRLWPDASATCQLLRELPTLLRILREIPPGTANAICAALSQTIDGMTQFMDASKVSAVQIRLQTVRDLQLYCYVVAGIVGEMLTDIFVSQVSIDQATAQELRNRSVGFGECLQLTNILKDAEGDALDGRIFIPAEVSRDTVLNLAFQAMDVAREYIRLLETNGFPTDIIAFCRFLCLLAEGTLNHLQATTGTAKLTREEVMLMLKAVQIPAGC